MYCIRVTACITILGGSIGNHYLLHVAPKDMLMPADWQPFFVELEFESFFWSKWIKIWGGNLSLSLAF